MPNPLDASDFAPIRADPRFAHEHDRREEHAAAARAAQATYLRLTRLFVAATAGVAILAALSLYGTGAEGEGAPVASEGLKAWLAHPDVRFWLLLAQAVGVALAGFSAFMLATRDYLGRWREQREMAETGRSERGRLALEIGHRLGPDSFRAGAAYFVADLIDGQVAYLKKATADQGRRAFQQTALTAIVVALAAAAPVLGGIGHAGLLLAGALAAVIAPALFAGLKTWGEATGAGEREKLHAATRDLLRKAGAERGELDEAVADNDLPRAMAYAERVFAALRTDVDGFLKITGAAPTPPAPTPPGPKR
ncbi:hypothetical protein [Rubrimonas cliftonensis]|uniref:Uncharacterized protein n=1 Tax=Rubrimonas cliftonensis TaxID=89524 RepID=A0A1H3Z0D1_9RHOB|nr:hypothetical protein [Rubrimonas cliftonensis]SEA17209.1 hypothetical protein SAMN05444370_103330 [Rubrimonas cliftonensis]